MAEKSMKFLTDALLRMPDFIAVHSALQRNAVPAAVTGVSGIHKAVLIYALCVLHKKRALVLSADDAEGARLCSDLNELGLPAVQYPERDFSLRDTAGTSHEYEQQRLQVLTSLLPGKTEPLCVISSIGAALQYTVPAEDLRKKILHLHTGQSLPMEQAVQALVTCGYERVDVIEGKGQFGVRGGILDFFSPSEEFPVRVEFWGDEIDSISRFDPETQRRTDVLQEITLSPSVEVLADDKNALAEKIRAHAASLRGKNAAAAKQILLREAEKLQNDVYIGCMDKYISFVYEKPATLFSYFAAEDSLLFASEPKKEKESARAAQWQWGEDVKVLLEEGVLCRGLDAYSGDWPDAQAAFERLPTVFLDVFAHGTYPTAIKNLTNMTARQLSLWGGSTQLLGEDLQAELANKYACVVLAGNERAALTVTDDLRAAGLPAAYMETVSKVPRSTVAVTGGGLSAGFAFPTAGLCVISHGKLTESRKIKPRKKDKNTQEIYSLSELNAGDYVVHSAHGIGIFDGIHKMDLHGITKDYIKIRYSGSDVLYVPVTQLDLVSKFIGPREDSALKLNKLGGGEWTRTKTKVRTAVKDIAAQLIKLYAERMAQKGYAFSEDTPWQGEFEAHFPFEETEDQLRCIAEIKSDMERQTPMDRLLCGDVGFGKTEVALRAAFKCIMDGKQCALLVPTTILAWQHFQTILKRMENFPVTVELLSRFRNAKQQEETIRRLKHGSVDIVIGTHRLLSKDVQFKDLGLVIIDEEQRFGVAQKERLKELRQNVDVLTLSATPIPRTLNMALSGIRDMSVIEEAPHDRHPVQTYVMEYDSHVILEAIQRELRRGGQVYYLHNDVGSIEKIAAGLQMRLPQARVGIGHGKMSEEELSEVWRKLLDQEIDILVCTTIIETGVDVPNANTLIIDNADRMGLSQLHQLRGRVGRSARRAYAYFTFAPSKVLSEISQKRLTAIREFTEFGSGFRIAMRDLEIRGAGNVLGGEQHGHMEAVGYDMYMKLLTEAVALAKGEPVKPMEEECVVDMQVTAHIPDSYISANKLRLEVYRMIADIQNDEDASDVTDELIDRFGEPPVAVLGLIDIALLRNLATGLGIREIKQQSDALLLYADKIDMEQVKALLKTMKGRVMLSAGTKPYISVKLAKEKPLDVLGEVLRTMEQAKTPA